MATITVLGAGMMGSAWCIPMLDRGHDVRLVGTHLDRDIIESLKASRVHPRLQLELPAALKPFYLEEINQAFDGCEMIGLGVSFAGVSWAIEQLGPHFDAARPVAMITKGLGLENEELRLLPDVIAAGLPARLSGLVHPMAVAGPCIAGEIARRVPTCVVLTGRDQGALSRVAELLRTDYYHVFTSTDVAGTEVGAALKNAYAMGIAFATGLHEARSGQPGSIAMHNHESAVFAQSLLEMQRIATLLGGEPGSVAGLAGAGDLDVTTNGGRTGRFGKHLGTGVGVEKAIEAMSGATLECLEILNIMRRALPKLERDGLLLPNELPLLRHMMEVALDDAPVSVPFESFFQVRGGT